MLLTYATAALERIPGLRIIDLVLAIAEMDRLSGAQPPARLAAGAIASNKVRCKAW
jgi:hypothetical protein